MIERKCGKQKSDVTGMLDTGQEEDAEGKGTINSE